MHPLPDSSNLSFISHILYYSLSSSLSLISQRIRHNYSLDKDQTNLIHATKTQKTSKIIFLFPLTRQKCRSVGILFQAPRDNTHEENLFRLPHRSKW